MIHMQVIYLDLDLLDLRDPLVGVTLIVNYKHKLLTYRHFLTPLQQMPFENIVAKGEIAHNEQFLLLS